MLTLKELNDRSSNEILEAAKEMIPHIFPEWTDLRAHDPGITFLELFAWLLKMLEDYQNKVTYKNRLKFLKLLDVRPLDPERAGVYLHFEGIVKEKALPCGTMVFSDGVTFETEEYFTLKAFEIEAITVKDRKNIYEVYRNGQKNKIDFYAFGERPVPGNALYLGLDGIYTGGTFNVKVDLSKDLWSRNGISSEFYDISMKKLKWEYLKDPVECIWDELTVLADETYELAASGIIKFLLPQHAGRGCIEEREGEAFYYIRCVLNEEYCEMPPKIRSITANEVKAIHGRSMSRVYYFSGTGKESLKIEMDGYLPYFGLCDVKVRDEKGFWISWEKIDKSLAVNNKKVYIIERNEETMKTIISFGESAGGMVPPEGDSNIMVVAYDSDFKEKKHIYFKGPLPNQVFRMDWAINEDFVFPGNFKIQVGNRLPGENDFKWVNFERVDDFSNSDGSDRHFVLDYKRREISFGNNEMGKMPGSLGENIIEIVQCTLGCGLNGNIKENKITDICMPFSKEFRVTNPYSAFGGYDGEIFDEALKRLLTDMKKQYRAVTLEDYEKAALSTPGLMVARAKAIPQFVKGQKDYPVIKMPGQLTVVVVPYSMEDRPMPEKTFLHTVKRYLNDLRLITTELHVIPPEYVKVKVICTVVVLPHIKFNESNVTDMLKEFLNPIGGRNFSGWPFGGTVRKGDIISRISDIPGVEYVKNIKLFADGEDTKYEKSGDIVIPPYALVYSGEHEVE
ncbi:MAG TPA: baseplate J/gp47 family protein, partial [Clostridia bacterium]